MAVAPSLKTIFIIFGGLCAAVAITFITLVSIAAYSSPELDQESQAYADAAVVAITSDWNQKDLADRASPQLMASVKDPADPGRSLGMWRLLGPLKKYDGSKGNAHIVFDWPGGKNITAVYVARAEFDQGSATIKISLVKSGGVWKIAGFDVVPDSLPGPLLAKTKRARG